MEESPNFGLKHQQTKADPKGSPGSPPSFLETTQSVNCVGPAKAKKVNIIHSLSKTERFVTIQCNPLLSSALRKDVRQDLHNSISKLKDVMPATL